MADNEQKEKVLVMAKSLNISRIAAGATVTNTMTIPTRFTLTRKTEDMFGERTEEVEYRVTHAWFAGDQTVYQCSTGKGDVAFYDHSAGCFLPEKPAHCGGMSVVRVEPPKKGRKPGATDTPQPDANDTPATEPDYGE